MARPKIYTAVYILIDKSHVQIDTRFRMIEEFAF
jgi:hypothetical protein